MLNSNREKSRRRFLGALGASAAWSGLPAGSAAQSRSPEPLPSDDRKLKITSVKAYPVAIGGSFRGATAKFSSDFDPARWRYRGPFAQLVGAIIVEIGTDQGIIGYGMGGGGAAAVAVVERYLSHLLVGANPLNVELLWDQMYSSSSYCGRRGIVVMALSGVDLALWDIAGKHAGRPVYQLIGGTTKDKVPAYYTGFEVEKAKAMGFNAFKIPLREGVVEGRDGMKRIEAQLAEVRKAIGPEAQLLIECGSLWDVPYTLEMDKRLAELRPEFFEEPLLPDDIEGYETLCREVRNTRIASGEHEYTRFGFHELIRHKAVHVLQPDITWSGGLTELRRIAALAAAHSLPVLLHRGGSSYGLNLILATPNCRVAESFGILENTNEIMMAMMPRFENGYYYPSQKPGFGVDLNEALIRKHLRE